MAFGLFGFYWLLCLIFLSQPFFYPAVDFSVPLFFGLGLLARRKRQERQCQRETTKFVHARLRQRFVGNIRFPGGR
jgi:hypothetical protein